MKLSAGLLAYRFRNGVLEVLLAHMGGPFHAKYDNGHWTMPKGEFDESEDALTAAKREFSEELGFEPPDGDYLELGEIVQHNKKTVVAWAAEADYDAEGAKSNTFELEWPPRSGKIQEFPEIDRAEWINIAEAGAKAIAGQSELFDRLKTKLDYNPSS